MADIFVGWHGQSFSAMRQGVFGGVMEDEELE